jgi:hypothetical protein
MLRMMMIAVATLTFVTASEAAQKMDAADRAALRRGYTGEKAKCYAEVSRHYYKPGSLRVSTRSAQGWKVELFNKCGISR